jgi:hypothetical protein
VETEFVLSLGEQRWTLPAESDTITIGRASNADIRLQADDQISRIHARLSRDGATWTLYDESRNGTGLNGHRITAPTALSTGDRIHIGRSVLTFHKSTVPDRVRTQPDEPGPGRGAPHRSPGAPGAGADAAVGLGAGAAGASSAGPASGTAFPPVEDPWAANAGGERYGDSAPEEPAAGPVAPPAVAEPAPGEEPWGVGRAAGDGERPQQHGAAGYQPDAAAQHQPNAAAQHQPDDVAQFQPDAAAQYPPDTAAQHQPDAAAQYPAGAPAQYPAGAAAQYQPDDAGQLQQDGVGQYQAGASGGRRAAGAARYPMDAVPVEEADEAGSGREQYGEPAYLGEEEYGASGVVPGFEVDEGAGRAGDRGWAAYPSADNPEPVRSPWEISARVEQAEPNWNQSDNWPEPSRVPTERRLPGADRRTGADRRANAVRRTNADRGTTADRRTRAGTGEGDAVGTVRLPRLLIAGAGIVVLGLVVNLIVTFLADGPGGELRWLVPPGIALVVAMVLALLDAAAPKDHRPGRLDVSILIAIAVVLVGVGVGGFALTAGTEYVGGYLTGNESGEDRLVKPVAKTSGAITVTVENVTYTSHFTRVEVMLANGAKEPITIPIEGAAFTAADGTALHADTHRSNWPSKVATGGTAHGTITFKGKLPDAADAAVLTLKSGDTAFPVSVALSN